MHDLSALAATAVALAVLVPFAGGYVVVRTASDLIRMIISGDS